VLAIEYYYLKERGSQKSQIQPFHKRRKSLQKFRKIKLPVLLTIGSPRHPVLAVSQMEKSSHGTHKPAQAVPVHHLGPRRESDEVLMVYGRVIELEVLRAQRNPEMEPHVIDIDILGLVASNPITSGARAIDILVAGAIDILGLVASNPVTSSARAVDILVAGAIDILGLVASNPVASSARAVDILVAAGHRGRHGGSSKS